MVNQSNGDKQDVVSLNYNKNTTLQYVYKEAILVSFGAKTSKNEDFSRL